MYSTAERKELGWENGYNGTSNKIGEYVEETSQEGIEGKFYGIMCKLFADHEAKKPQPYTLEIVWLNQSKENGRHHDYEVYKNTCGVKTLVCKIEFEFGDKQDFWVNSLEDCMGRWGRGCSIAGRKIYQSKEWDFFIKSSRSCRSFFMLEYDWFHKRLKNWTIQKSKSRHSLNMVTGDYFANITWDIVEDAFISGNSGFIYDDFERLVEIIYQRAMKVK